MINQFSTQSAPEVSSKTSYVIFSGYHDFRSKRRANLHFIADELRLRAKTYFVSVRYSYLTKFRDDPRQDLWKRANKLEVYNQVGCFLWRTPVHAMRLPRWLALAEHVLFAATALYLPRAIREIIADAGTIFIESGIAIIYLPLIRRLNPNAQVIYMASDSLRAIKQAGYIVKSMAKYARFIDGARVPSPFLQTDVPAGIPCFYIPHGIDKRSFDKIGASPFLPGSLNAVSVGSMLFDPGFFEIAGALFPDITFHAIGSGYHGAARDNVKYYPEMPFATTLPFLYHCTFAIAPYDVGVELYLTQTSMKLMQYDYLGLPSVCPTMVAGNNIGRFGYQPGNSSSIKRAIDGALAARRYTSGQHLTWAEVTARLLNPAEFDDTRIQPITETGIHNVVL